MARRIIPHATGVILATAILLTGEIAYDETARTIRLGDGATQGGLVVSSQLHLQNWAKGDGATNDRTAIAAAAAAAPGRVFQGGGKVYAVTNTAITITGGIANNTGVSALPDGFSMADGQVADARQVNAADPFSNLFMGHRAGASNRYIPEIFYSSYGFWAQGNHNIYLGDFAGELNTQGRRNTIIGSKAFRSATTANYCVVIGAFAAEVATTISDSVIIGTQSGGSMVSGTGNVLILGGLVTKGDNNVNIGLLSGSLGGVNFTANRTTFLGYRAGAYATTCDDLVALGADCYVSATTLLQSAGFGAFAGQSLTTQQNWVVGGWNAARSASAGNGSTVIGSRAGYTGANIDASTLLGDRAGYGATSIDTSVIIGKDAEVGATTLTDSVSIGYNTGSANLTGIRHVIIGGTAGVNGANYSNVIVLGYGAIGTASNTVTLGNASIVTLRCAVTTITAISDARDKAAIEPLNLGLDFIRDVQMRRWTWAMRGFAADEGRNGSADMGVVAQELGAVAAKHDAPRNWFVNDSDPDRIEASPGALLYPLIEAVKELAADNDTLRGEIAALRAA